MSRRHVADAHGKCVMCGESYPCPIVRRTDEIVAATRQLADRGGTKADLKRLLDEKLPR